MAPCSVISRLRKPRETPATRLVGFTEAVLGNGQLATGNRQPATRAQSARTAQSLLQTGKPATGNRLPT